MKDLLPLDTVSSYAQHRLQRARELARSAWAMVAMLTIGLVVVALLSLLLSYRLQTALAEQRVQNMTQNAARLLEITLHSTQNQLSMVAEHIAETKGYTNINNYLSEQVYRLKGVRKILFINPLGRVLASSKPEDALIGRDVSQRPFYKAMVALNAQARFSTPEAGLGDNQPRWLYSYAVKNEADLRLGILVAIFDNEALTTHLISGRDTAFMVQFDDDIIAQSLPPDAGDFINQRTDYIVSEQSVTPWPITITAGLSKQHVLHNITEQLWLWGGLLSGLLVLIWVLARLHVQHVLRLYLQAAVIERQNIDLRSAADNLRREGHERVQAESQRDGFFTLSADLLAIISHEGRFERVNPAFSSVLGEDEARLRGVDLVSFIHTDEAKGFRHALEQLEDGGGAIALEARVQTRLGFCWFLWTLVSRDKHIYAVAHDFSAHRAAADALREAKEAAELANHTKTQFLANMSHELRTPLNAIIGFSQTLDLGIFGALNDKQQEYVRDINRAGEHLLGIVADLLDLSVIDSGAMVLNEKPVAVADLITETLALMRPRAEQAQIHLTAAYDGVPMIKADAGKIRQILVNLVGNAAKFTPAGGRITVRAGRAEPEGGLYLEVQDTGIGIKPADIPTVLSPFGRLKSAYARSHGGVGLGLPLSSRLAELHGGQLTITSAENIGTSVRLWLPAARILAE